LRNKAKIRRILAFLSQKPLKMTIFPSYNKAQPLKIKGDPLKKKGEPLKNKGCPLKNKARPLVQ